jgi:dTDP-4-amino-4,6-dideoxygalactose transaminase
MPHQDDKTLELPAPSSVAPAKQVRWHLREYHPQAHAAILEEIGMVLREPGMTNGNRVAELERQFAAETGSAYCIAVSSATMGLTLGLQALATEGLLLAPAFGFPATILAGLWNGFHVHLLPVDHGTLTLDAKRIEAECAAGSVAAIIAIAVAGNPSGLRAVRDVARRYRVPLVIDAAACQGATVAGESLADLGDLVILSLSEKKVMPIGEGGIVLTNNAELADRVKMLRTYGAKRDFDCVHQGFNGRLSEIHAAIAIQSMSYVPAVVTRRRQFATSLNSALSACSAVQPQLVEAGVFPAFSDLIYRVPANRRDRVIAELRATGLNAFPFYDPPLFGQRAFQPPRVTVAEADRVDVGGLAATTVGFKTHSTYGNSHRDVILHSFQRALSG